MVIVALTALMFAQPKLTMDQDLDGHELFSGEKDHSRKLQKQTSVAAAATEAKAEATPMRIFVTAAAKLTGSSSGGESYQSW